MVVSVVRARDCPKYNFGYESTNGDALVSLNGRFGGLLSRKRVRRSVGLAVASSWTSQVRSSYSVPRWGVQNQHAIGEISEWFRRVKGGRWILRKAKVFWFCRPFLRSVLSRPRLSQRTVGIQDSCLRKLSGRVHVSSFDLCPGTGHSSVSPWHFFPVVTSHWAVNTG